MFTIFDYLCINIQINLSLVCLIVFLNLLMLINLLPEIHPGIMTKTMQLANSRNLSKIVFVFLTMSDDRFTWTDNVYCFNANRAFCGYKSLYMHMFVKVRYIGRVPALFMFCTNNLLDVTDIGHISHNGSIPPFSGFIGFMFVISTTFVLYQTPLYMNCMSHDIKDYSLAIVIDKHDEMTYRVDVCLTC